MGSGTRMCEPVPYTRRLDTINVDALSPAMHVKSELVGKICGDLSSHSCSFTIGLANKPQLMTFPALHNSPYRRSWVNHSKQTVPIMCHRMTLQRAIWPPMPLSSPP